MKIILVILSFLTILNLKSNFRADDHLMTSPAPIPYMPDLDSLWKIAQEEIILVSTTLVIRHSFWHTAMPGADKKQTCWNLQLSDKNLTHGFQSDFQSFRVYFIKYMDNKNEGYDVFEFEEPNGWRKDHKFYFNPAGVILEIFDEKKNRRYYLKKLGPFPMGRVE